MIKKLTTIILTGILMAGLLSIADVSTYTLNPNVAYAFTSHTQAEAVEWACNQEGSTYEWNNGYQCVDLIRAYYSYLGQPEPTGNANEYLKDTKNHKPDGWEIIYGIVGIQPGDITVYEKGDYGHVAIVIAVNADSCTVMQQNGDGNGSYKTEGSKGHFGELPFTQITGYIHPDFKCKNHTWDSGKTTAAASCKTQTNGEKIYTCKVCGDTKTEPIPWSHKYKTIVPVKATLFADGFKGSQCSVCGDVKTTTVYYPETIRLKKTSVIYTGKWKRPGVIVIDRKGNVVSSKNYTVSYSNNKKVGKAKATVKFKGDYTGKKILSFIIYPPQTAITKLARNSKTINVKWKRKGGITGYRIQYATDPDLANYKYATVKGSKKSKITIRGLKAGTTYYVRIQTYCKVGKKKYYSNWSSIHSITTKDLFSTEDGCVYWHGVKKGKYMYVVTSDYIYKVNLKKNKKKVFYRIPDNRMSRVISGLCIYRGYLYFEIGAAQYEDPDRPSYVYRRPLSGGKVEKVTRGELYKISGGKLYSFYTVDDGNGDYGESYYYVSDPDGKNKELLKRINSSDYSDYINVKWKYFNVPGYKFIMTNTYPAPYKAWLKKPNGKKIYLGKHFSY